MTTKDTADRTAEAIDFTMMYATHNAFRRDLSRFTAASAAGTAHAPGVRAGWENFKAKLLLHHSVEDTHRWPRVRRAAAGRPAGLALLKEMEAEHEKHEDRRRPGRGLTGGIGEHTVSIVPHRSQ